MKPTIIPIFNQESLQKAIFRGLEELSSNVKVVIVKTRNHNVSEFMIQEPEPFGIPGDYRPKDFANKNFQIVQGVFEICKKYTNRFQVGDI